MVGFLMSVGFIACESRDPAKQSAYRGPVVLDCQFGVEVWMRQKAEAWGVHLLGLEEAHGLAIIGDDGTGGEVGGCG